MATKEASLAERVQSSYKQLVLAATNLNIASDELSTAISVLERALDKLNLGVSAWATITGGEEESVWWSRDIGYTQIVNQWVIAVRSCSGDYQCPDGDSETVWRFSLAPRWMQNEAVAKIPDLFDKLTAQARDTRNKLKNRAEQASQLAAIVEEVSKNEDDWFTKLRSAVSDVGLPSWVKALANADAEVFLVNNELKIKVPKRCQPNLTLEEIRGALKHLGHPDLRFKVIFVPDRKNTAEQSGNTGKAQ
jgi:hypothetical protein